MNALLTLPIAARLVALFLLGLGVGGFLNLGIYRLAWNRRSISPWSRHPEGRPRRWFARLPVVGWFFLRREEEIHGPGFWVRPMLVELLTGAGFAGLYWWEVAEAGLLGPNAGAVILLRDIFRRPDWPDLSMILNQQYLVHAVLFSLMMITTWIDIDEKTIPDAVTVTGTLAALALAAWMPFARLPSVVVSPDSPPILSHLWLTTPNDDAPWLSPTWNGMPGLLIGIGCFWLWCVALMPFSWRPRHGLRLATQILMARLRRQWSTYGLLLLAAVGAIAIAYAWSFRSPHWASLLSSLVGMAIGGGIIWLVRLLGSAVLHREAMGFGDVTLMAMIGAFLGWQAAVIVFFIAPLAGLVVGLALLTLRGESEIPYGPFLCLATLATIVGWDRIWDRLQEAFALGWFLLVFLVVCLALIVVLLPIVRAVLSLVRRE